MGRSYPARDHAHQARCPVRKMHSEDHTWLHCIFYFKQAWCPIFLMLMNYRKAHAYVSGWFIPKDRLTQGIGSDAPPTNKSLFHTTSRQRLHKQTDGEGDGERASVFPPAFHSLCSLLRKEETASEIPQQGWTSEPERDERLGGRLGVFTAPFCMRNRLCAKVVGAAVSILMLRVNRESMHCPLHQWTQPRAPAWLADCSTLTGHPLGIKRWIQNDEVVKKGKTFNSSEEMTKTGAKQWFYKHTHSLQKLKSRNQKKR